MRLAAAITALVLASTPMQAQDRTEFGLTAQAFDIHDHTPGEAFLAEAIGGTTGAFVGGGILLLMHEECDVEDLSCILDMLGTAGIGSIAGATAATYVTGRIADTRPSLLGAGLGAVAGLAAGVGIVKLFDEAGVRGSVVPILALTVTEGSLAALGSRLLSR